MISDNNKELFEANGFKCIKCSYYSPLGEGLEINKEHNMVLCSVCNTFAPAELEKFKEYVREKISWQELETFRKFKVNKASHNPHRQGMIKKSKGGKLMTRPAYGYRVNNGNLIPDEQESQNVKIIFEEFLNGKSLNQIAIQFQISVNGIKKILKNFTYLGKIKFAGSIAQGSHSPIISPELFNRVQQRFELLNKTKSY